MMGLLLLDGRPIGDDGRDSGRSFASAPKPVAAIMAATDVDSSAQLLRIKLAKNAARRYRKNPRFLDAISLGLSASSSRRILAVIASKTNEPIGGNPLGALVIPVNMAGARIYARWLRRFEERGVYRQAAE